VAQTCPQCGASFVTERLGRGGKITRACAKEGCGYKEDVASTVA